MATVSDLATKYRVSTSTIRSWTEEFGPYLTLEREGGQTRIYSSADEAVLGLVATMRSDGLPYDAIHEALRAGERWQPPLEEEAPAPLATQREIELAFNLAQLEGRYQQLEQERDHLRGERERLERKIEEAREELAQARERAAAAEAVLKHQGQSTSQPSTSTSLREPPAPGGKQEARRRGWLDRLLGR